MKVNFLDIEYDSNLANCAKKLYDFIDDGINRFSIWDDFENHYIIQDEKTNRFFLWEDTYETFSDEDLDKLENGEVNYIIGKDKKEFLCNKDGLFYLVPIQCFDEFMAIEGDVYDENGNLVNDDIFYLSCYTSLDYFRVNLGLDY